VTRICDFEVQIGKSAYLPTGLLSRHTRLYDHEAGKHPACTCPEELHTFFFIIIVGTEEVRSDSYINACAKEGMHYRQVNRVLIRGN